MIVRTRNMIKIQRTWRHGETSCTPHSGIIIARTSNAGRRRRIDSCWWERYSTASYASGIRSKLQACFEVGVRRPERKCRTTTEMDLLSVEVLQSKPATARADVVYVAKVTVVVGLAANGLVIEREQVVDVNSGQRGSMTATWTSGLHDWLHCASNVRLAVSAQN
jgi:hypothetical protein